MLLALTTPDTNAPSANQERLQLLVDSPAVLSTHLLDLCLWGSWSHRLHRTLP